MAELCRRVCVAAPGAFPAAFARSRPGCVDGARLLLLLRERRLAPGLQKCFHPSTKAYSLLSQIRMKRFPFQLLPQCSVSI